MGTAMGGRRLRHRHRHGRAQALPCPEGTDGEWSGMGTAMGGRRLLRCRYLLVQNRYNIVCCCRARLFCWNGYEIVCRCCCLLLVLAVAAAARARCCWLCACCSCSLVLLLLVRVLAGSGCLPGLPSATLLTLRTAKDRKLTYFWCAGMATRLSVVVAARCSCSPLLLLLVLGAAGSVPAARARLWCCCWCASLPAVVVCRG